MFDGGKVSPAYVYEPDTSVVDVDDWNPAEDLAVQTRHDDGLWHRRAISARARAERANQPRPIGETTMENWLSKIDPNTVVVLVGALGGWLWAKASGKKTESLESRIESAIRQEAVKLLSDPDVATKAKPALEQAADRTLAAIGVKRTKLIDAFVAAAVERALTTLAEKLIVVHLDRAGQTLKRTADELE